jgi:hypothetical protein
LLEFVAAPPQAAAATVKTVIIANMISLLIGLSPSYISRTDVLATVPLKKHPYTGGKPDLAGIAAFLPHEPGSFKKAPVERYADVRRVFAAEFVSQAKARFYVVQAFASRESLNLLNRGVRLKTGLHDPAVGEQKIFRRPPAVA